MNTFQLECFMAVAENLSFAKAAEVMNISQPAITHQIKSLEALLGVQLFTRTTRTVKLTEAGEILINDAEKIIDLSVQTINRFKNYSDYDITTITIGFSSYVLMFPITPALKEVMAEYPHVHPSLKLISTPMQARLLEEESIDILFSFEDSINNHNIKYKELCRIPIVATCSKNHPLASREKIDIKALQNENLILIRPNQIPTKISEMQGRFMEGHQFTDFYFCDSYEAATILASTGIGIALLPDMFSNKDEDLINIPIKEGYTVSIGVYYKTLKSPIIKKLLEQSKTTFQAIYKK